MSVFILCCLCYCCLIHSKAIVRYLKSCLPLKTDLFAFASMTLFIYAKVTLQKLYKSTIIIAARIFFAMIIPNLLQNHIFVS